MSEASYKFEKADRTLMQRLFEPPRVGKLSPVASVVAYAILVFWSAFVIFPHLLGRHHRIQAARTRKPRRRAICRSSTSSRACTLGSRCSPKSRTATFHRSCGSSGCWRGMPSQSCCRPSFISRRWRPRSAKSTSRYTNSLRHQRRRDRHHRRGRLRWPPMRWRASSTGRSSATSCSSSS